MEYKSQATLFGLPLVHIALGRGANGVNRRGPALGWIAIGDVAFGVLFAAGGIAVGGVAVGGLSLGVLALAGLAVGGYAVGGLAIGIIAVGGMAFAGYAAYGGGAIAWQYSLGGLSIAHHANDSAARDFTNSSLMRAGKILAMLLALGGITSLLGLVIVIANQLFNRRPMQ